MVDSHQRLQPSATVAKPIHIEKSGRSKLNATVGVKLFLYRAIKFIVCIACIFTIIVTHLYVCKMYVREESNKIVFTPTVAKAFLTHSHWSQ